jgi:hypothetical protein
MNVVPVGDVKPGSRVLFKGREVVVGYRYTPMRSQEERVELVRFDGSHVGSLRPGVKVVVG